MTYSILILAMLFSVVSQAARIDTGDNKNVYFDESGKKLDALEAFKEAMADKKILQCSYVEAVGNQRTGKVNLKKKQ